MFADQEYTARFFNEGMIKYGGRFEREDFDLTRVIVLFVIKIQIAEYLLRYTSFGNYIVASYLFITVLNWLLRRRVTGTKLIRPTGEPDLM